MAKVPDVLKDEEKGGHAAAPSKRREDMLAALRRLRQIGEGLPAIDAAAVIREGRNLPGRAAR